MDKGSYLSESWNCLDFFIVMSSIADMSLSFLNIKFVKILPHDLIPMSGLLIYKLSVLQGLNHKDR